MKHYFALLLLVLMVGVVLMAPALIHAVEPPQETKLTDVETLKMQVILQQHTILTQQQQLLQHQYQQNQIDQAALLVQAKTEFEAIAKAHKQNLVFDPQSFQLVPGPAPVKAAPVKK